MWEVGREGGTVCGVVCVCVEGRGVGEGVGGEGGVCEGVVVVGSDGVFDVCVCPYAPTRCT